MTLDAPTDMFPPPCGGDSPRLSEGDAIPTTLTGFVSIVLAAVLGNGCTPEEVCPGGSVEDNGRCLLVGQDVDFPNLEDGGGVRLADTVVPGVDVTADAEQGETGQKDGSKPDDDAPSGPTDTNDATEPDPTDVGTDTSDLGEQPPDNATDNGGGGDGEQSS